MKRLHLLHPGGTLGVTPVRGHLLPGPFLHEAPRRGPRAPRVFALVRAEGRRRVSPSGCRRPSDASDCLPGPSIHPRSPRVRLELGLTRAFPRSQGLDTTP